MISIQYGIVYKSTFILKISRIIFFHKFTKLNILIYKIEFV